VMAVKENIRGFDFQARLLKNLAGRCVTRLTSGDAWHKVAGPVNRHILRSHSRATIERNERTSFRSL
jgi:hypothetical protein